MIQRRFAFRALGTLFLLISLFSKLLGEMSVPAQAAPQMQAGTADLSLTMTVNNATPNKVDTVIFSIKVTNLSTTDIATGVTVQSLLPSGVSYVSDNSGGTYNPVSGNWVVGTVAANSSVTLNILTKIITTGTKTHSATISVSSPTDPNTVNNTSSVTVTPKSSDLSLSMTSSNYSPSLGDIITITIVASNSVGSSNATGVKVNDVLPAGLAFISYTSTSGTYTNSTGNWSVGNLNAGSTKTLSITASVSSIGTIVNSAEIIESDQLDPDSIPDNGSEDDYANVSLNGLVADLSVIISVNNATPNKTDDVIFTITVSNAGPSSATGVTVKDILPVGVTYQSDTSGGAYDSSTGIWLVGSLPVGASNTFDITLKVTTTGAKTNTVQIFTSNQADTNAANNSSSVIVTPKVADLSIIKAVDKNAPNIGETVIFTITVNNVGPDTATGVSIKDALPAGYSFVSDDSGGFYSADLWSVGTITVGSSRVLNVITIATADSHKTNNVEVFAVDQLDPDSTPNNNSVSEDDDDAAPKVDLSIAQTSNIPTAALGANIIFTLKVNNTGPATATGVVVKDLLPVGVSYVSDDGGGSYDPVSGLWSVGTIFIGTTKTLNITAKGSSVGAQSNFVEVWLTDQFDVDSVPGNNSTTEDDDDKLTFSVSYPVRSVLINEVAWAGTASALTSDEWIELYNPGSASITLDGWVLKTADGGLVVDLSGGSIPAGGYFLLERTDDTTVSDIIADKIYTGELSNSNETLNLYDPINFIVDTANSNSGMWPAGSASTYGSMERSGVVPDSDTTWITNTGVIANGKDANGNAIKGTPKNPNWAYTVTATPLPRPTSTRTLTPLPPAPPPPLIVINEFVPRPGHDYNNDGFVNVSDEYIELLNHGVVDVNLSGYRLDDEANVGSSPFSLPSTTLKPGERIVFYGSQTGLLLSDGGDGVRLLKPNGQLMDAYNYSFVEFPDQSFCRLPDDGGADDWNENCFPTPGLKNTLSGVLLRPPTLNIEDETLCPIADTLPYEFVLAECTPFGENIWNRFYWDQFGWYGERILPAIDIKWDTFFD